MWFVSQVSEMGPEQETIWHNDKKRMKIWYTLIGNIQGTHFWPLISSALLCLEPRPPMSRGIPPYLLSSCDCPTVFKSWAANVL